MAVLLTNQPQSPTREWKKRESDSVKGGGERGSCAICAARNALRILPPKVLDRVEGDELLERLLPVVGV